MTEAAVNDYAYWDAAKETGGRPIPDSPLQCGFYRLEKGKVAKPVAIWRDQGSLIVAVRDRSFSEADPDKTRFDDFCVFEWPNCAAVTEERYRKALAEGHWDDHAPTGDMGARHSLGGNNPPQGTLEAMLAELNDIGDLARPLVKKGAAKTEDEGNAAANLKSRAIEVRKKIVDAHKVEKEPWLKGGKAVDEKFFPHRDKADLIVKELLRKVIEPFQIEQRRIADAARAEAAKKGVAVEAKPVAVGARGRKTSLQEIKYGKVTDAKAFAAWLAETEHPEMVKLLPTLATRIVLAGATAPGIELATRLESR